MVLIGSAASSEKQHVAVNNSLSDRDITVSSYGNLVAIIENPKDDQMLEKSLNDKIDVGQCCWNDSWQDRKCYYGLDG